MIYRARYKDGVAPYVMIPIEIIDDVSNFKSPDEKMIYIIVLQHEFMDGEKTFPSLDLIARKAKCSRRTVVRKINDMVSRGLMKKERRFDGGREKTLFLETIEFWKGDGVE